MTIQQPGALAGLRALVSVAPRMSASREALPGAEAQEPTERLQGVFITKASFVSFPVASGIVFLIWKVLQAVAGAWAASALAALVGVWNPLAQRSHLVFRCPNARGQDWKDLEGDVRGSSRKPYKRS